MPRYTRCPYYIDESRRSISCEDVCRSYSSENKKWAWMDMYCDSWDWMKCPYAMEISEAYRRYEEGDEMALIEQELKAQKKEIESLLRKLGRANKKLDKERAKNKDLESQKKIYFEKWRTAADDLDNYEKKIAAQIQQLADTYEVRLAYMVDRYEPFSDADVEEWAKDKAFALVYSPPGVWKVKFQEEETEDVPEKIEEQVQE